MAAKGGCIASGAAGLIAVVGGSGHGVDDMEAAGDRQDQGRAGKMNSGSGIRSMTARGGNATSFDFWPVWRWPLLDMEWLLMCCRKVRERTMTFAVLFCCGSASLHLSGLAAYHRRIVRSWMTGLDSIMKLQLKGVRLSLACKTDR
jgi:hypothetical protein